MRPSYRYGNKHFTKSTALYEYWQGGPCHRLYGMPCAPDKKGAVKLGYHFWKGEVPNNCLTGEQKKNNIQPDPDFTCFSTRKPCFWIYYTPAYPFAKSSGDGYYSFDGYEYMFRETKVLKRSIREGETMFAIRRLILLAVDEIKDDFPFVSDKKKLSEICMTIKWHIDMPQFIQDSQTGEKIHNPEFNLNKTKQLLLDACRKTQCTVNLASV